MSGCEYCDVDYDLETCDGCEADVCRSHRHVTTTDEGSVIAVQCSPDPATHPGAGCYRPLISDDTRGHGGV